MCDVTTPGHMLLPEFFKPALNDERMGLFFWVFHNALCSFSTSLYRLRDDIVITGQHLWARLCKRLFCVFFFFSDYFSADCRTAMAKGKKISFFGVQVSLQTLDLTLYFMFEALYGQQQMLALL
jgi:hypothetical protein